MRVGGGRVQLLDRSGNPISHTDIEGGYLLPLGPDLEVLSDDPVVLQLAYGRVGEDSDVSGEAPDVPVGRVPLVVEQAGSDLPRVHELVLPPPAGFTEHSIDSMWHALATSPSATRASIRRAGLWDAGEWLSPSEAAANLPSLPDLLAQTRHLLHHWPQRESLSHRWRPLGQPGGTEDVRATVRRLAGVPSTCVGGRLLPERTLRRHGSHEDWTVWAVSDLATRVFERLTGVPGLMQGASTGEMLAPLAELAAHAEPPPGARDVPPSSWPHQLRTWFEQAQAVLAQVHAHGLGHGRAPLCQFRDLYEAWVATEVHLLFERQLGVPAPRMEVAPNLSAYGKPAWRSQWGTEGVTVVVWAQPAVRDTEVALHPGVSARSVTSVLIPDVLVVATDGQVTHVHAVDAKFTTRSQIQRGTIAETGSKYLWGLRSGGIRTLVRVTVVSNGTPSPPFDGAQAAIDSIQATPSIGSDDLADAILSPLAQVFPQAFPV